MFTFGNSIYIVLHLPNDRSMINNAIAHLNIKSNNLLADFSFSNSSTLSVFEVLYCMNIYGSTLWRYNNHSNIDNFFVCHGGKLLGDYGRRPIELIIVLFI